MIPLPLKKIEWRFLGFVAIRGYIVLLFGSTGSNLNAYDMVLISRCFTLLGQLVSSVAMPYIGRKVVYCVSCALTGVSLIGFGWAHWLHPLNSEPFAVATRNGTLDKCRLKHNFSKSQNELSIFTDIILETIPIAYNWFPAIFLCLSAFGFCFGLSGIPLSYSNELIPADVRLI